LGRAFFCDQRSATGDLEELHDALREVRDALSFATEGTELRTQRTRKMMRDGAIDNAPFCFLGEVATVKAAAGLPHSKGEDAG